MTKPFSLNSPQKGGEKWHYFNIEKSIVYRNPLRISRPFLRPQKILLYEEELFLTNKQTNYKQWKKMGKEIIDINDRLISILTNDNYSKLITVEIRDMLRQAKNLICKFNSRAEDHMLAMVKPPKADGEKWEDVFYPNIKLIDCFFDELDRVVPLDINQCRLFKGNPVNCENDSSICLSCIGIICSQDNKHAIVKCII